MIQILLVDDQVIFREALTYAFEQEPEFTVTAQAGSLIEVIGTITEVDLAVIGVNFSGSCPKKLLDELSNVCTYTNVLIVSATFDHEQVVQTIEAGATVALHKSVHSSEIVETTKRLYLGIPSHASAEIVEIFRHINRQRAKKREAERKISRLTSRERDVLRALASGLNNRDIARELYIGVGTVRTHMASILSKLEVDSKLQALVFAIHYGIVKI